MINYKSFKLPGDAKLRIKTENIIATVSSKNRNVIDLYVAGIDIPFHVPVEGDITATELIDEIWERTHTEIREED